MAYTVDPLNAASPLDSDFPASLVASELRQLKARINTLEDTLLDVANNVVFVGCILAFPGAAVAPANFMLLPTVPTNVSRTTYAKLFTAIGTIWGTGDGSTTFGLPYLEVGDTLIRGTPGSITDGDIIDHTHAYKDAYYIESSFSSPGSTIDGYISIPGPKLGPAASDSDNDLLYYRNATTEAVGSPNTKNKAAGMNVTFFIKYQ